MSHDQSNRLVALFEEEVSQQEERPSGRLPKLDMQGGMAVSGEVQSGRLMMALVLSPGSEEDVSDQLEEGDEEVDLFSEGSSTLTLEPGQEEQLDWWQQPVEVVEYDHNEAGIINDTEPMDPDDDSDLTDIERALLSCDAVFWNEEVELLMEEDDDELG